MELQGKKDKDTQSSDQQTVFKITDGENDVLSVTFKYELNASQSATLISKLTNDIKDTFLRYKSHIKIFIYFMCLLLYLAYVGYSLHHKFGDEGSWRLLIGSAFGLVIIGWKLLVKLKVYKQLASKCKNVTVPTKVNFVVRWILYISMLVFFCVYTGITVLRTHPQNLISLVGIVILLFILFVFSTDRSKIKWHTVFWSMSLQFMFGIIILKTSWGKEAINYISQRIIELISHADSGAEFVFTAKYKEFPFVFQVMPQVIVFCTILSVLNYLGVMHFIIKNIGGFLAVCLNTSPVESIAAAANIFVGPPEVAVIAQDYLPDMPLSELFCILVTGLSSIAGIALIVFSGFGIPAEYLLAANVMSAPAALAVAKISMPDQDKEGDSNPEKIDLKKLSKAKNMLDAVSQGGVTGLSLATVIITNILIFIALLALINSTLAWFGERAGVSDLSVEFIGSYVLWPLAYIMGIDSADCGKVAELLGLRAVTDPGIAYIQLDYYFDNKVSFNKYQAMYNDTTMMTNNIYLPQWNTTLVNGIITDKSEVIASYALCGFASIQSVGVSIGIMGALAPNRRLDLINIGVRSFIASSVASFLTACVAGLLFIG